MWTILQFFIEFVIILLLFYDLVFWPKGVWDLSSQPGVIPTPPALGGKVIITAREVPLLNV